MDYKKASDYLKIFRNQTKDISPALATDWKIKIDRYYQQGTKSIVSSEELSQEIDCGEAGSFMENNFLSGNIIIVNGRVASFKNNLINYNLCYTSSGFITEEDFYIAEDIVEQMNLNKPFKPSELKVSSIYKSMEDEYYIHMGNPNESYISIDAGNTIIKNGIDKKEKKKFLLQINKKEYIENHKYVFEGIVEKTSKLKLIEEFESISDHVFKLAKIYFYKSFDSSFFGLTRSFNNPEIYKEGGYPYNHKVFELNNEYYALKGNKKFDKDKITMLTKGAVYYNIDAFIKIDIDNLINNIKEQIKNKIVKNRINSQSEKLYGFPHSYKEKDSRELIYII